MQGVMSRKMREEFLGYGFGVFSASKTGFVAENLQTIVLCVAPK
jgi:hypothetical protein